MSSGPAFSQVRTLPSPPNGGHRLHQSEQFGERHPRQPPLLRLLAVLVAALHPVGPPREPAPSRLLGRPNQPSSPVPDHRSNIQTYSLSTRYVRHRRYVRWGLESPPAAPLAPLGRQPTTRRRGDHHVYAVGRHDRPATTPPRQYRRRWLLAVTPRGHRHSCPLGHAITRFSTEDLVRRVAAERLDPAAWRWWVIPAPEARE